MNSKINRVYNRVGSSGVRGLALALCFVMLFSAIGAGSVLTAVAQEFGPSDAAVLAYAAKNGAETDVPAADGDSSGAPFVDDIEDGFVMTKKGDSELAATGDTTYYMHIGVQSAFRTSSGVEFTYDSTNNLYYASYNLVKNNEYPMVINTTSGSLGDGNKSSSTQSVTSKASTWNPDSIQFDYFDYKTNNYDGYDCFKFKTQTSQTVYFTFTSGSSQLVVRSTLPSGGSSGSGSGSSGAVSDTGKLNAIYFKSNGTSYWQKDNARVKAKITYSDSTNFKDYMTFIPNSTDTYVLPVDSSKVVSKVQFFRVDPNDENDWNTSNELTVTAGNNLFTYPASTWSNGTPTQSTYTTMNGYIPDILGDSKIMFYYGDTFKNDDGNHVKYLNDGSSDKASSTSLKRDSGNSQTGYFKYYNSSNTLTSSSDFEASIACIAAARYYVSNKTKSSWGGIQMAATAEAGRAYVLTSGSACATGYARGGASFTESGDTWDSTNSRFDVVMGTAATGISAAASYSKSAVDATNRIYYAYEDQSNTGTYYDFNPNDASSLPIGTYNIYAIVADGGLLVKGDTTVLNISSPPTYAVTIKSNNSRLGTGFPSPALAYAGQTVTITISENMGTFSSIAVKDASDNAVATTTVTADTTYTFVMPSSAATVNLTFAAYSAKSNFYYNSYETDGEESGTRYAQQMTEGKINGQEYSYYHVDGRTGSDQPFTISMKNPAHDSTVFFRAPYSWSDKHGWDGDVQVQFFSSDGVQLKDWAWMTFDKWWGTDWESDKVWKASIPYGARKVQFRTQTNDPSTYNWPYTAICDLKDLVNNDCFYINSYTSGTGNNQSDIKTCNVGNQTRVIPENFYEYFYDDGIYTDHWSTSGFSNHNASHTGSHKYIKPSGLGVDSGDYYILVLYSGKTYTINGSEHTADKDPEVIWVKKLPGTEDIEASTVSVYAKDGPIVIDWNNKSSSGASATSGTAYGYSVIADTEIYDGDNNHIGTDHDDDGASYESASVEVTADYGTDVIIKTTISSAYKDKYYLKGWCINGVTYACGDNVMGVNDKSAGEASGSDMVYTMTYTVPAGTENNAKIEITPIYYLKDNSGCITFYLEGYNTISSKWGDTPYVYPFYGDLNNVDNSFGVYPGQPMVYADGQYSIEIPIENDPIIKATSEVKVKGITVSNGYADHVHRNLVNKWSDHDNDADHKQTYDYDDFYKIYEECLKSGSEHPNAIIFRIHDEETVYNRSEYGGGKSGQFASGTGKITISDIEDNGNGWELLTNRYGHAVNIFGTQVTDPTTQTATTDTADAIYVVSTGYNANIAGDYGTMWKIYDGSGALISNDGGRVGIPPSVLVMQGSSSGITNKTGVYPSADRSVDGVGSYKDSIADYDEIYKALQTSYTGKRVYITYEKDAQDTRSVTSGTGAYRLDGRWYYTHASDSVHSTIGIEYWDESEAKWVADTMSGTAGTTTGCTAKFSNDSTTSPTYVINNNEAYSFSASAAIGWKFDSWQFKYSATSYDEISTSASASVPASLSYEIVARFVPVVQGSLTINHTLNTASSGEGDVTMAVNVYTDSTMEELVSGFTVMTGSRVYLDDTYISNNNAYYIEIELKTTPKYDGTVSEFTYDSFNASKSITADEDTLPGGENALTTSTFSFPVSDLYGIGSQTTKVLNYTSLIDATDHYYNFVYSFTDRAGTSKSYTSKGVLNLTEYKKVVSDQANHVLYNSILVSKAPFESNFLKSNTLNKGEISYNGGSHTYSADSSFTQSDALPTYHVIFKLPYSYYTVKNTEVTPAYKKYTANDGSYNDETAVFTLAATYNTFVTVDATASNVGANTNVEKVSDSSDVNHVGNDFLTAPETLDNSGTTMYFKYWEIKKGTSTGDLVTYLYYPDFHYRVYSDYYVKAVYSDNAADSWKFNYSEADNEAVDCSVLYLGDSRNQWNNGSAGSTSDSSEAADMIYNDFIFHYSYKGQELCNSEDVEVGMILERATYLDNDTEKWLSGSTSVNDMNYYRATYGGSNDNSTEGTRKTAISNALNGNTKLPNGTVKVTWENNQLNNKNFTEQSYSVYSAYGQTVANDTITFATDNAIDNYVYRAYAYMKADNGTYVLSDPVYFCMRYTSNLGYTE